MDTRHKLTLEEKHSYLLARVRGHANPGEEAVAYLKTIAEHCARCGCPAILIEKETPEPFALWDTFAIAPRLARVASSTIKIAVVDKACAQLPKSPLAVMVGSEPAICARIFTDIAEAERWLLTGQTSAPVH